MAAPALKIKQDKIPPSASPLNTTRGIPVEEEGWQYGRCIVGRGGGPRGVSLGVSELKVLEMKYLDRMEQLSCV